MPHPEQEPPRRALRTLACALAAAALAGGAQAQRLDGGSASPAANPVVYLNASGRPVVFSEPLFFRKDETDVQIVWRLPANHGLRFPDDGIVIEGELTNNPNRSAQGPAPGARVALVREQDEIVGCKPIDSNTAFTCLNRHTRPGTYKYTVKVVTPGGVVERDPQIMND